MYRAEAFITIKVKVRVGPYDGNTWTVKEISEVAKKDAVTIISSAIQRNPGLSISGLPTAEVLSFKEEK